VLRELYTDLNLQALNKAISLPLQIKGGKKLNKTEKNDISPTSKSR
jgi:hypothetical protein